MTKYWSVTVEHDGEDLILPLPDDMLKEVGWNVGDVLEWHDNNDGTWSIMKKQKLSPKFHEMALAVGGSHYPEVGGELLQKFGEMVVRECANIANEPGARIPGYYILKHFGVEE